MAEREIAESATNEGVPAETLDRVLAQADDVLRGKASADWRADWTYEWANSLLALSKRVERQEVTLQLIDDACRNTSLDAPVGLLTADIRAHILALARAEVE